VRRVAALGLALVALGPVLLRSDWVVLRPTSVVRTGTFGSHVSESSGVAASARRPGLFWTVLDSGNDPAIIAIDSAGQVHDRVRLGGATNDDWEAVAVGPCPTGVCVYVGDIGDNRGRRESAVIYRVPEPDPAGPAGGASRAGATVPAEALAFRYPDGARDAEALIVTPEGDILIVTKGVASAVKAYRIPAAAWSTDAARAVAAEDLGALPIAPRTALGRWVTDAALVPGGRRVAIRTYRDIFLFVLDRAGTLQPSDPPVLCDISGLESQGEGITWADDSTLVLTSESGRRAPGTVHYVSCPWP
jgi:hypothetical protein